MDRKLLPLCTVALATVLVGLSAAPSLAQNTVYDQPPVFPAPFSAWTSSSNSVFTTSDNFLLGGSDNITALTWQGFTFDATTLGQGAEPGSFTVQFRANNGGVPGAVLSSQTIGYTEQLAGTSDFFGNGQIEDIFNYSANLNTTFSAPGSTPLWLSVIGNETGSNFWTWAQGTGGDSQSYQEISTGGSTARPGDRAFSLIAVTPESSPLLSLGALLGLGAGWLFVARRRVNPASS